MALVDIAATFEDNVLKNEEIEDIISEDLRYRDKQLLRLKDEVLDIEDLSDSVSLTEFTLDDFRLELLKYIEANRPRSKPRLGLYTWSRPHPDYKVIGPGVIFCFRQGGHRGGMPTSTPAPASPSIRSIPTFSFTFSTTAMSVSASRIPGRFSIFTASSAPESDALHGALRSVRPSHQSRNDMKGYDALLHKAVDSVSATFRKRAASGLDRARLRSAQRTGADSRKDRSRSRHMARHQGFINSRDAADIIHSISIPP